MTMMNEQKFRELARKADFALWEDEEWKPEGAIIDWGPNYDREIQKFAELIINECVQVAKVGMEFGPSLEEAVYAYFGIKSDE